MMARELLIDAIFMAGAASLVYGVAEQWGLAWAHMVGGAMLLGFAIRAQRAQRSS